MSAGIQLPSPIISQDSMIYRAVNVPSRSATGKLYHGPASVSSSCWSVPKSIPTQRSRKRLGRSVCALRVRNEIFGVGAPEAVLVVVVSLALFGPKGLANIAKQVGQAVRSLQPTIRELTAVSQDLSKTINDELGIDETTRSLRSAVDLNPPPPPPPKGTNVASSTPDSTPQAGGSTGTTAGEKKSGGEYEGQDLEAMRKRSLSEAWGSDEVAQPVAQKSEKSEGGQGKGKDLSSLSVADLEAELKRRKESESQPKQT